MSVATVFLVGFFSIYFLFHYSSSMEERIYRDIDHHGEVDLHRICSYISCNGLFYNGKFYSIDPESNEISLNTDVDFKVPSEIYRFRTITLRSDFSFMLPLRSNGFEGEADFFIDISHFTHNFIVMFLVLFVILNVFAYIITHIILSKEEILHEIELNKDKASLQFDNLMFYIENLNHEVNSPLFILTRKIKELSSRVDDKKTFEIINNSLEQIGAVMQRTREVKRINRISEDRTVHDLIESTILTIDVMRAENIKGETDQILKNYYLDQTLISNGMFINVMTNHIKNSIEAFSDTLTSTFVSVNKNKLTFIFADNGNGVPEQLKKKIFDRGFSTKGDKLSRGAGLSINRYILESAGGSVKFVDNSPGAIFELTIPVKNRGV